jgi:membrane associated rhomboid family serine protease
MTPWVRRLIIANVAVFLLQTAMRGVTQDLVLLPALVLLRPWTLVTYMFAHGGIAHILFNMLALYWFGPRVEERLGSRHFIVLYFISGIGGALLSFATPSVPILGASGAIMGVLMAYAMYWPHERFLIYGVLPIEAWLLAVLYVAMDVLGAGGFGGPGIAHFAHLGGAAGGFLYLKALEYRSPARAWKTRITGSRPPSVLGDGDNMRRWREIRLDDLHAVNRDEIVRLLEKAQSQGTRSLTPTERATLDRFAGLSSPT